MFYMAAFPDLGIPGLAEWLRDVWAVGQLLGDSFGLLPQNCKTLTPGSLTRHSHCILQGRKKMEGLLCVCPSV